MLEQVKKFVEYAEDNNLPIECICLSDKNGKIYDHYFKNWKNPKWYRQIYSHTKSFTTMLLGHLVYKGLVDVEDTLDKYFDEEIREDRRFLLKQITIKNLLTMTSGFGLQLLMEDERRKAEGYPDYLNYIFSHDLLQKPGSSFLYSNGDTYIVGRIVEKVFGKPMDVMAYDLMFKPMGMNYPLWEKDPQGHCFGASGLHMTLDDMNKLGILYLNDGVINGERIVSHEWIEALRTKQVRTLDPNENYWWGYYSYQSWITPYHRGFRADGAYGQHTHIFIDDGYALSWQCPEDGNFDLIHPAIDQIIFQPFFNKK